MKKLKEFEQKLEALKEKQVPEAGKTMEIAGMKWMILEETDKGYVALAAEPIEKMIFGKTMTGKKAASEKF